MEHTLLASTISGVNRLSESEKRAIYSLLIPNELLDRFQIDPSFMDGDGNDLLSLHVPSGSTTAEMELRHTHGFQDPVLYGEITDSWSGRIHVLLYVLNDPASPRFDVDRMPDGTRTKFGTLSRNLSAETAAMAYGLAPGQVRQGLKLLKPAIQSFERFVAALGQDMYFVEPLYYHNAIIFERYGFAYQKGRRLMERIHAGFAENGELRPLLDGSTPFRQTECCRSCPPSVLGNSRSYPRRSLH